MNMNVLCKPSLIFLIADSITLSGCDKNETETVVVEDPIENQVTVTEPEPAPASYIPATEIAGRALPQNELVMEEEKPEAEPISEDSAEAESTISPEETALALKSGTLVFIYDDGLANTELVVDVFHCITNGEVDQACVQSEAEKIIPGTTYRRTDYCINSCDTKGQSEITRIIEG
jgi:hypothetical protein